jgi:predicted nucleic acid-binding protein
MGSRISKKLGTNGKALFDTNILIDHLNDSEEARKELRRYEQKAVSIITWIEVMVGAASEVEAQTREFLKNFHIVEVDGRIAEIATRVRRQHRIKLPDALIWATAQANGMLLVTRNTKDFPADDPGVRMPYRF